MRSMTQPESQCAARMGATEPSPPKETTQGRALCTFWNTRRADVRFRLSDDVLVCVQQLGATDEKEVQRVRGRDCLGEERLVRAWRPYNSEVSSESVRGYEHIL
jgi:hypothetical protein